MKRPILLLFSILALHATPAAAQEANQPRFPMFLDTGSGDVELRSHAYMSIQNPDYPQLVFVPDRGLNGDIFLTKADGSPGWQAYANANGWNTYSLSLVGCGKADPPPTDDLVDLTEKSVFGVYQIGVGTQAQLLIAHGAPAAFAIKARALDKLASKTAVLLDAWGPPGSQSRPAPTVDEVVAESRDLEKAMFRRWGAGKSPGRFARDSDLGKEGFDAMLQRVQRDQPAYWATLVTGFVADVRVADPANLEGWHVLLVQGPYRSADEVRWEDELAAWLRERGVHVDRMALTDLGLPGISALPMSGRHADAVLEHFLAWSSAQTLDAAETGR